MNLKAYTLCKSCMEITNENWKEHPFEDTSPWASRMCRTATLVYIVSVFHYLFQTAIMETVTAAVNSMHNSWTKVRESNGKLKMSQDSEHSTSKNSIIFLPCWIRTLFDSSSFNIRKPFVYSQNTIGVTLNSFCMKNVIFSHPSPCSHIMVPHCVQTHISWSRNVCTNTIHCLVYMTATIILHTMSQVTDT